MTTTYTPRRGDLVTCDAMTKPHEVYRECGQPVLVERPTPEPLAPFARVTQAAKGQGQRFCEARS